MSDNQPTIPDAAERERLRELLACAGYPEDEPGVGYVIDGYEVEFYNAVKKTLPGLLAAAEERDRLAKEVVDLRDALRLCIGMRSGIPWTDVLDLDVDGYLQTVRGLKQRLAAEAKGGETPC